jgi:putative transposase
MDFVHDQLVNGRVFRVITVVDNWSRESPVLEVGFRLTGDSVVAAQSRVASTAGLPASITVDHGTEITSKALDLWAWQNQVQLDFTRPGKPTDNGICKSFNGRLRDECLNVNEFTSLDHAKALIEAWRQDYNHHRPHGALGKLTPSEYAKSNQARSPVGARFQF